MILQRLGNKNRIASTIINTFPKHNVYIEPFFGAGGLYFNKQKSLHNLLNDIDDDVFNLWDVFIRKNSELIEKIESMPITKSLFDYWIKNKETDEVMKALRFLMLSNFSIYGTSSTFHMSVGNTKNILIQKFFGSKNILDDSIFSNYDFREFYKSISWGRIYKENNFTVLSYNDPPYLGTSDNYSHSFTEQDSFDLFEINCQKAKEYPSKYFFAMSDAYSVSG